MNWIFHISSKKGIRDVSFLWSEGTDGNSFSDIHSVFCQLGSQWTWFHRHWILFIGLRDSHFFCVDKHSLLFCSLANCWMTNRKRKSLHRKNAPHLGSSTPTPWAWDWIQRHWFHFHWKSHCFEVHWFPSETSTHKAARRTRIVFFSHFPYPIDYAIEWIKCLSGSSSGQSSYYCNQNLEDSSVFQCCQLRCWIDWLGEYKRHRFNSESD